MKKYINPGYSNITRTSTRVTNENGETLYSGTIRASNEKINLSEEDWLEIYEMRYKNYLVKAEQFENNELESAKKYKLESAKKYLIIVIKMRMKMIKKKYCE